MTEQPPMKKCIKCQLERPLLDFHRLSESPDGYRNICKACRKTHEPKNFEYVFEAGKTKKCRQCKSVLPATPRYFHRSKECRGGLNHACIGCVRKNAKRGQRKHVSSKIGVPEGKKRCTNCRFILPATVRFFDRDKQKPDGLYVLCKKCNAVKSSAWVAANRQRHNISVRQRYRANPKRQQQARISWQRYRTRKLSLPAPLTTHDWQHAINYFNGCCAVCGRPPELPKRVLAREHWIPLADPRPDNPGTVSWNIVPMCHSKKGDTGGCNNSKSNKDPVQWLINRFGTDKAAEIFARITAYFDSLK